MYGCIINNRIAQFKYSNKFEFKPKFRIIDELKINKSKILYSLLVYYNLIQNIWFNHNYWKTHY